MFFPIPVMIHSLCDDLFRRLGVQMFDMLLIRPIPNFIFFCKLFFFMSNPRLLQFCFLTKNKFLFSWSNPTDNFLFKNGEQTWFNPIPSTWSLFYFAISIIFTPGYFLISIFSPFNQFFLNTID